MNANTRLGNAYLTSVASRPSGDTTPRLTIDLIPSSAWESNVRTRYPEHWDFFRRACYRAAGHRCETCHADGRMECHEVWTYDRPPVQELQRLICLCPTCHLAQHYGLATIRGLTDVVDAHIRKVNDWTKRQLSAHIRKAMKTWEKRNDVKWVTSTRVLDAQADQLSKLSSVSCR